MTFSTHAEVRCNQRGISKRSLQFIYRYGQERRRSGAIEIVITDRAASEAISELKNEIKMIEKMKNKSVLVDGESVITTFHSFEKWKRDL